MHLTLNVHQVHNPIMTKLDEWMGEARDDFWLAQALGCSRSQASRIRRGKSVPSLETAVAIERMTRGKVKPRDLLAAVDAIEPANDNPSVEKAA